VKLTVVGSSGSFPGPDSSSSCYLLQADGFSMVVDLGSGSVGQLQRYVRVDQIDAVLISHLHADHCMDLLPLYVARTYDPTGKHPSIPVHAPSGAAELLMHAYGRSEPHRLDDCFRFVEWSAGTYQVGPFTVTVARVAHPIETWGMRIEHGGAAVAYSADTGPCDALVGLSRGADLALYESSFEAGRDDKAPADLHMTGGQAGAQAVAAGAKRLLLTHLPPWNDPEVSLAAGRASFTGGPVEVVRPGATYEL
jgi:ribonuclease BN (tRNA processing enzyme)